ncbi:MAG: hypothetical protein AAGF97_15445 [Planctomycetota bacterium]
MSSSRLLVVASLFALVSLVHVHRTASAIPFTWIAGNGNWHVPQFWSPFAPPLQGPPGAGDVANIAGDRNVTLTANAQGLAGLTLQSLGDIFTNGNQLSVANVGGSATATVVGTGATGNNTEIFVESVGGNTPGFTSDHLDLVNGGELDLTGGGITHINNRLDVDAISVITGDGTIVFTDTHNLNGRRFDLRGTIRPDINDTITLVAESGTIDWDGQVHNDNLVDLTNTGSRLVIDGPHTDSFTGTIEMGQNSTLESTAPWELGPTGGGAIGASRIRVNAGNEEATISGGELTMGGEYSNLDVYDGRLTIQADSRIQSNSDIFVANDAQFNIGGSSSIITGGDWNGSGTVNLDADMTTIASSTTVNMPSGTFDLDGNTSGDTVTINSSLQLNVASIDDDPASQIGGTVRINGAAGQLNVQLTDPNQGYGFNGVLELNGPGGGFAGTHLIGADVELAGTTMVSGNSIAQARVDLSGNLEVAANAAFRFQGGSANQPNIIRASASVSGNGDLVVGPGAQLNVEDGGLIAVNVDNRGRFESGLVSDLGATVIDADYIQGNGGVFGFEIAGPPGGAHDVLHVTQTAQVDGELEVATMIGYVPEVGDLYTVMSAGTRQGTFDTLTTAGLGALDFDAEIIYSPGLVQLSITDVTLNGDFNGDLGLDCADVDALVSQIAGGGGDPVFDLTGDGVVDMADLDQWLDGAGTFNVGAPYLPGDANLDGLVDGSDFLVWNEHKFSSTAAWCQADFNADGVTDGLDYVVWNENKFTASMALTAVPEPAVGVWVLLGVVLSFRRHSN